MELSGINIEYYSLMDKYNSFRVDNYDIPIMINQFLKVVNKYPDILSDKRWLDNEELANFFNKEGKIKSIEELKNIHSRFTKYFVASEEFLTQNNLLNMNSSQKMLVNDCINRVIAEREEKDRRIKSTDIKNVVKELKKYGLNPNNSSKNCELMASKTYYDMLREYSKLIKNKDVIR